jgi:hemerythrin superfamily protein
MGKTTAKVKGAASKVGAAISGKVGVLNTLEGEHAEVSTLMNDVINAKDAGKKRELYQEIRQQLLLHSQGEEQGLYLECQAHDSTRSLADKAIRDHVEIKQLLAQIDGLALGTPEWSRRFDELESVVSRHVDFEENQLFPAAKDTLGSDALRDLDHRYKSLHKRVEERGERLEPGIAKTG